MQTGKRTLWISERLKGLFAAEGEQAAAESGKRRRVLDFFLVPGRVQSKLQDENGKFHRVELGMRQFTEEEWATVCKEFAQHALFLASFLTSRIPEEAETILRERGIALLPQTLGEALDALEADPVVREGLGEALAAEFLRLKRMEWIEYSRHVSDWERERYVEFF